MKGPRKEFKDRKLGSEWFDWDGNLDYPEPEFARSPLLLPTLLILFTLCFLAILGLILWALFNFIFSLSSQSASIIKFGFLACGTLVILIELIVLTSVLLGVRLLSARLLRQPLAIATIIIGKFTHKIGLSRDRLSNSFMHVINILEKQEKEPKHKEPIMVLLPRCIEARNREQVISLIKKFNYKFFIAAKGEVAREMIKQHRPGSLVAVACERDLITGLRDVQPQLAVLSIAVKRPFGPCKDTSIDLEELHQALLFLNNRMKGTAQQESQKPNNENF